MKYLVILTLMMFPLSAVADLADYATLYPGFDGNPILQSYDQIDSYTKSKLWDTQFKAKYGPNWKILIDVRSGIPAHVYGEGIPLIPGDGNDLPFVKNITKSDVVNLTMGFIKENAEMFGIDPQELALKDVVFRDKEWNIIFERKYKGLRVLDSLFRATIGHGNLIKFGAKKWGKINIETQPTITSQEGLDALFSYLGVTDQNLCTIVDHGSLALAPIVKNGSSINDYTGKVGEGYGYKLVWSVAIQSDENTWRALIDAHSGEVLSFRHLILTCNEQNADKSGSVRGYIYLDAITADGKVFSSISYPMPYADLRVRENCYNESWQSTCGTNIPQEVCDFGANCTGSLPLCYSDMFGQYHYLSDSVEMQSGYQTRLVGKYIYVEQKFNQDILFECSDSEGSFVYFCSNPVEATYGDGDTDINLGGTDGEDSCSWQPDDIPCGNNNAARTAYFHGNYLKEVWRNKNITSLTNWLEGKTKIKANWGDNPNMGAQYLYTGDIVLLPENYTASNTVTFNNSGEYPSLLYHELGHGLDSHDGEGNPFGSGVVRHSSEAYADIVAVLMTHDPCIGRGYIAHNTNVAGYSPSGDNDACIAGGDGYPECNGIRDISYLHHENQTRYTPDNFSRYCPVPGENDEIGPCGREAHLKAKLQPRPFGI